MADSLDIRPLSWINSSIQATRLRFACPQPPDSCIGLYGATQYGVTTRYFVYNQLCLCAFVSTY